MEICFISTNVLQLRAGVLPVRPKTEGGQGECLTKANDSHAKKVFEALLERGKKANRWILNSQPMPQCLKDSLSKHKISYSLSPKVTQGASSSNKPGYLFLAAT